ncbi:MAG: YlxR family protein [Dermatophilaceae bacterium]|nr:YlxR family protein [Intrasporangiaceae bacterium]
MRETDRTGLRRQQASHVPTRTCLGCRRTDSRSALLRVTAREGDSGAVRIVPDVRGRLGGRGAWLHTDPDCVEQAVRRRAFARALRVGAPVDLTPLTAYLDSLRS